MEPSNTFHPKYLLPINILGLQLRYGSMSSVHAAKSAPHAKTTL
jgi:hypothetical protein